MTTYAEQRFFEMLSAGNVAVLRAMLLEHQEYTKLSVSWGENSGTILHYAAHQGQKDVIRLLVNEMGMNINDQKTQKMNWSPLHHAAASNSLDAIKTLLELGADISLRTKNGETPLDFCQSENCRKMLADIVTRVTPRPDKRYDVDAEKRKPVWTLSSNTEVVCNRITPDGVYRLTDVFNFETRRMTSIALELKEKALAQTVTFFDDIPDKKILKEAHTHLLELGGFADFSVIWRGLLPGKNKLPGTRR